MEVHLIGPDDRRWRECLAQVAHDFYHLPRYVALCAEQEEGRPYAALATDGESSFLLPLILRPVPFGRPEARRRYDATSPYGYPSPLAWRSRQRDDVAYPASPQDRSGAAPSDDFFDRSLAAVRAELLARGVVSLFVRLHPILKVPLEPLARSGTLVHHGETVYLDLTQSEHQQWHQMRPPYRNRISRAERLGLVAEIDEPWATLDEFYEIYTDTMHRVQASDYYFFSKQYFLELREALEGSLHMAVVRVEGDIACAGLYSEVDGIVQLHLTGNRPEHAEYHATKYMLDFVRRWSRDRGNRIFHLGGGLGARNDSLLYFKAGFSKLRSEFYTWRSVLDTEAYERLVGQWQQAGGEAAEQDDFFPVYRRPLPRHAEPLSTSPGQ